MYKKAPGLHARSEAYIGVMIDDLITRGTAEPYRMFTSRAEYRLLLREDNADLRLTEKGRELGLVDDQRWAAFSVKKENIEKETKRLQSTYVDAARLADNDSLDQVSSLLNKPLTKTSSLFNILQRPEINYENILQLQQLLQLNSINIENLPADVIDQVEIQCKYSGYINRQLAEIEKQQRQENKTIPDDFDYTKISSLSNEVMEKLIKAKPQTIGQASRVPGVTPAAISLVMVYLKKHKVLTEVNLNSEDKNA